MDSEYSPVIYYDLGFRILQMQKIEKKCQETTNYVITTREMNDLNKGLSQLW